MPYIGTTPTKVVSRQSANVYRYTATAGQSVFTGADLDNNVLACNPADMIVHMNGLRLESTDYTATSTSVTLTTAATAGDEVTVTSFVTFEVADTYTKTAADDRYVNASGDTMTGALALPTGGLTVGTDQLAVDSAGRVTMPYQPAFHAYIGGGNPSFGSGVNVVPLSSTLFNVGNHWDTTNYRFTAPVAGVYAFFNSMNVYNVDTGQWWRARWFVNGSGWKIGAYMVSDRSGDQTHESSLLISLSANDYVECRVESSDTSYLMSAGTNWNSLMGYLIG